MNQLEALGLDIPVCGLAKADEEVFVPWDDTPVVLPSGSASLYLIKQVRDESHRFAITFHRELRDKAMTVSVLDEVPGVGPKRKRAIMRRRLKSKGTSSTFSKRSSMPSSLASLGVSRAHASMIAWSMPAKTKTKRTIDHTRNDFRPKRRSWMKTFT